MCNPTCSESGKLRTIQSCGWYKKLESDLSVSRAALTASQLRCGDAEVEAQRLLEALKASESLLQELADMAFGDSIGNFAVFRAKVRAHLAAKAIKEEGS